MSYPLVGDEGGVGGSFSYFLPRNLLSNYYVQDFYESWRFRGEQEAPLEGEQGPL